MAEPDPVVRSRQNPLLRELRRLKARAARESRLCLLEGARLIEDALDAGLRFTAVAASPAFRERHPALERRLRERGAAVRSVRADLLEQISELESGPGVVAIAERPAPDPDRAFAPPALVVAACGVQDPGNLGALLRTAEAAGAGGALLGGGCADPHSWKALRGSMGSALRLPVLRHRDDAALLAELRRRGVRTVAAVARDGVAYDSLDFREPTALVVGGEARGLPHEVLDAVDRVVAIPMRGRVESLNVAVAAGVLLFEAARQRRRQA